MEICKKLTTGFLVLLALIIAIPHTVSASGNVLGGGSITDQTAGENLLGNGTEPAATPAPTTSTQTSGGGLINTPIAETSTAKPKTAYTVPGTDVSPLYPFDGSDYLVDPTYNMPYIVGVDTINQVITIVEKSDSGRYDQTVKVFICSTGTAKDPTPAGTYILPASTRGEWAFFKTYNCYVRYPVRIQGNYFFHSLLYKEKDLSTQTSSSRRNLGKAASHGCIRMWDHDVQWLSENALEGTLVAVYAGESDSALNKALR